MIGGRQALAWQVGGVIALTLATAIALALLLAYLKFEQRLLDITGDRLELVLEEVRRQTETGLALGLELAELEDLSGVLQRAARARDVVRIEIWNDQGRILFSTQADRVGSHNAAIDLGPGDGPGPKHRLHGDKLQLSLPLTDGFGRMVGTVGVTACLSNLHQSLVGVRNELLATATPVVSIALVLSLVAVILIFWLSGGLTSQPARDAPRDEAVAIPPLTPPRAPIQAPPQNLNQTLAHPGRLRVIITRESLPRPGAIGGPATAKTGLQR